MNTKLNTGNLKLNGGEVNEKTEIPLFVGLSNVTDKVNGRNMKMSVSIDRTWLWLRFPDVPSQQYRQTLIGWGFRYSGKRGGWGGEATDFTVNKVRSLGALTVPELRNMPVQPVAPQMLVPTHNEKLEPVDMDELPKPRQNKGKQNQNRKPVASQLVPTQLPQPTALSLYDSEGQYIGLDYSQPQPAPQQIAQPAMTQEQSEISELRAQVAMLTQMMQQLLASK